MTAYRNRCTGNVFFDSEMLKFFKSDAAEQLSAEEMPQHRHPPYRDDSLICIKATSTMKETRLSSVKYAEKSTSRVDCRSQINKKYMSARRKWKKSFTIETETSWIMVNFFSFFFFPSRLPRLGCHDDDDTPKTLTHKKSNDRFSSSFSSYKNCFNSLNFYSARWEAEPSEETFQSRPLSQHFHHFQLELFVISRYKIFTLLLWQCKQKWAAKVFAGHTMSKLQFAVTKCFSFIFFNSGFLLRVLKVFSSSQLQIEPFAHQLDARWNFMCKKLTFLRKPR